MSLSRKQIQQEGQVNRIEWIERLLQTPIEDFRKQCLWRILCPYLINIKKLNDKEAEVELYNWLQKCNQLKNLSFNPAMIIRTDLKGVKSYMPPKAETLREEMSELYYIIKSKDIFND